MLKIISSAVFLMAVSVLNARPEARIDIASAENPTVGLVYNCGSDTMSGTQASWLNENKDKRLVVSTPVTDTWKQCSFTFTPKASGTVSMILMGNSKTAHVFFNNISVEGMTLLNGTFDKINSKGLPDSWTLSGNAQLVNAGGETYVKVHHDDRFSQNIKVEEGRTVKITFNSRAEKTPEADFAK